MPNLQGLGLQNFRTFKERENLEFAPITIITGTNNSGKSSVFKAIQFLVNNFKDGIDSDTLDFKTMRHELGNFDRIYNRVSMASFKNSPITESRSVNTRLGDLRKRREKNPDELPIFEENEDLVFAFPIKFGNSREIAATLEIRYDLNGHRPKDGTTEDLRVYHFIKSIAVVKDGQYLHWTNIIGERNHYDEPSDWDMRTSLDLKKIIQLIIDTSFVEIREEFEPSKETEKYFTNDLFNRIKNYDGVGFDLPFFKRINDGYEPFKERIIEGKSLFSDYSELTAEEQLKLLAIEQMVITDLFHGRDNSQSKILECFKHSFSNPIDGMERKIANAELINAEPDEKESNDKEKNLRDRFKTPLFPSTDNSKIFTHLLAAIEKDFSGVVQNKIDSLSKVYFLPTTRGRNREWFIDEQNSEDIEIVREFSAIDLKVHPQIQNFVNFWIGKGEIGELDESGNKKLKGFKIGKELLVFRDETIGLTKIFLVNFDGTKTPLVDLGYGVSQLLPIIMKIAIVAQKHQLSYEYDFNNQHGYYERETIYFSPSTLLIEEPEANLHPSLQSKMAELFIDAGSRFNIQFLIETHSEYLIYKFQEYVGKKIVSASDIKMYYFNHPNDVREGLKDEYISHVQIDKDGSIDYEKYFGKGFFDEQTNLKLSLLNIQRDHFVDDYNSIKEELIKSKEVLEGYDARIEELNEELSTATSGKTALEEQISAVKREKEERELELQELLSQQEEVIETFTDKINYSRYLTEIGSIIDITKIDNAKTLKYLATGKYLLNNLDNDADFAPVIIQYGRAVEFQMIKWVNDFRVTTSVITNVNSWCSSTNYTNEILRLFTHLGLALDSSSSNLVVSPDHRVNLDISKKYIKNGTSKLVFGELTQIFELLHYISPALNTTYNYTSVPLIKAFSDYLKSIWRDYDTAELVFNTCREILDLRNCAGHTYSSTVCTTDIISKSTAENYIEKVEAIFRCL